MVPGLHQGPVNALSLRCGANAFDGPMPFFCPAQPATARSRPANPLFLSFPQSEGEGGSFPATIHTRPRTLHCVLPALSLRTRGQKPRGLPLRIVGPCPTRPSLRPLALFRTATAWGQNPALPRLCPPGLQFKNVLCGLRRAVQQSQQRRNFHAQSLSLNRSNLSATSLA